MVNNKKDELFVRWVAREDMNGNWDLLFTFYGRAFLVADGYAFSSLSNLKQTLRLGKIKVIKFNKSSDKRIGVERRKGERRI